MPYLSSSSPEHILKHMYRKLPAISISHFSLLSRLFSLFLCIYKHHNPYFSEHSLHTVSFLLSDCSTALTSAVYSALYSGAPLFPAVAVFTSMFHQCSVPSFQVPVWAPLAGARRQRSNSA
uniref:Uncharacterized protein n=1 Tax=Rousettus aegyptiacus TaxID=9407 RepID=A0A7J8H1C0_ROUAE|nr:hypothetical protein HJG63_011245 [Rousettus aegyptiacus]